MEDKINIEELMKKLSKAFPNILALSDEEKTKMLKEGREILKKMSSDELKEQIERLIHLLGISHPFLELLREMASQGMNGKDVVSFLDTLSKPPEEVEKEFIREYILDKVPNPENYDFSIIQKISNKEIIFVYDKRIQDSVREDILRLFLSELEQRIDKMGNCIYFVLHKEMEPDMVTPFLGGSGFFYQFGPLPQIKINEISCCVSELMKIKKELRKFFIRHEIFESILEENDVPRYCEIKWMKTKEKLYWYENLRNAIIDTIILEEDPKIGKYVFNAGKEGWVRAIPEGLELTQKGRKERYDVYLSFLLALENTEITAPFKIASEKVPGGYRGSFSSYYLELDRIARKNESYFNPLGTELRKELENELFGFKIIENKIDDEFCKHIYEVIDNFVNKRIL